VTLLLKYRPDLKRIFSKYSSPFSSDVFKIVSGTALAQAFGILASPIITRIYVPEAFGVAALFSSIAGIIAVVACLRYEMAIMLPKKDEDAANLLGLCLFLAVFISLITIPTIWLSQETILRLLNSTEIANYLWLTPMAVFFTGAFMALNYWNTRSKQFGRLSIARINASIATIIAQIGAGVAGYATGGSLIGASIFGSAVSTLVLAGQIWRDDRKILLRNIRLRSMSKEFSRHRKFPIMDTWSGLLNSISSQMPIFIFSIFFSPTVVGYYALGHMVLQLPMTFIGSAVGQVFFQRAAEAKLKGTLPTVVDNTFSRLTMVGLYPIIIIFLIGKDSFVFFFGSNWAEAGIYAQILSLWILLVFMASPLSTLFAIFEKQEIFLLINILLFISRAASLVLGGLIGNARFALMLYAFVGLIIWVNICLWILNISKVPIKPILRRTSIYLYYCLPVVLSIITAKYLLHLAPLFLIIISMSGAIIYYVYNIKKILIEDSDKTSVMNLQIAPKR